MTNLKLCDFTAETSEQRSDDTQTRLEKTATGTHLYERNIPRFMRVLGKSPNTLIDRIHQPNTKKQKGSEPSSERNNHKFSPTSTEHQ
ncbi:hypothetical protein CEXT_732631 [Caerostris extrusa]|uniref:Uncharacterized protein n=1 Tax=Caerostris extrusa TaxID=172846 RepID=A0AAV4R1H1_CAEEX|nr:hypothetical protein CEXT_732631 [Caerostris extrusa]